MKTELLNTDEKNLREAGRILALGGLVAFPTETVYGLGANGLDEVAVKKIYKAKGRPSDNPLILHISSIEDAKDLWSEESEIADVLMKKFWPGPLTIVMKSNVDVPKITRGYLETVAVRFPENEEARKLISAAGVPIAAPSANISGRPSPTKYKHVIDDMEGKIDAIICGDDCQIGIESTVVLIKDETVTILRPGYVTHEEIEGTLQENNYTNVIVKSLRNDEEIQNELAPISPGMKYRHYAPKARMIVFFGEEKKIDEEIKSRILVSKTSGEKIGVIDFSGNTPDDAARLLFAKLREMDEKNVDIIYAKAVSTEGIGFAIMNRMIKSAGYEIIKV